MWKPFCGSVYLRGIGGSPVGDADGGDCCCIVTHVDGEVVLLSLVEGELCQSLCCACLVVACCQCHQFGACVDGLRLCYHLYNIPVSIGGGIAENCGALNVWRRVVAVGMLYGEHDFRELVVERKVDVAVVVVFC